MIIKNISQKFLGFLFASDNLVGIRVSRQNRSENKKNPRSAFGLCTTIWSKS